MLATFTKNAAMKLTHVAARFWREEEGVIVTSELILIVTLLVIGLVAALAAIRAAIVTELADFSSSVGSLSQSFSVGGTAGLDGSFTGGSAFFDASDAGDNVGPTGEQAGPSACIIVVDSNVGEGGRSFVWSGRPTPHSAR